MKKGNKLYRLINSLSGSEKRHFTLYAQAFQKKKENNEYITFFHLIDKHKIQDEHSLQKLSEISQFKNLPTLKSYLYKKIIESLILNSNQNIDELFKDFLGARQLFKRGLYEDASYAFQNLQKKTKKLNTSLTEYDNLFHQFAIKRFEVKRLPSDKSEEMEILLEMQQFLEIQKTQNEFVILEVQVNTALLNVQGEEGKKEIELFLTDPLLNDSNFLKNDYCQTLYYSIKCIIYSFLGKSELYVECAKQRFEYNLQLSNKELVAPKLEAWRTLLFALIQKNDEKEFMNYIDFFKDYTIPLYLQDLYVFFEAKTLLAFCCKNNNTNLYIERNLEEKTNLLLSSKILAPLRTKSLLYFRALYYFKIKDFESSLATYDKLIIRHKFESSSKTELSLAILYFLILIEKQDFQYASNQISTFQRRVKVQRPEDKALNTLLNQLQRYSDNLQRKDWNKNKMLSILEKMEKTITENPYLEYANLYRMMYLSEWVEEKQQYYRESTL